MAFQYKFVLSSFAQERLLTLSFERAKSMKQTAAELLNEAAEDDVLVVKAIALADKMRKMKYGV